MVLFTGTTSIKQANMPGGGAAEAAPPSFRLVGTGSEEHQPSGAKNFQIGSSSSGIGRGRDGDGGASNSDDNERSSGSTSINNGPAGGENSRTTTTNYNNDGVEDNDGVEEAPSTSSRRSITVVDGDEPPSSSHYYSPFTDVDPPGPDVFTRWFAGEEVAEVEAGDGGGGGSSSSSSRRRPPSVVQQLPEEDDNNNNNNDNHNSAAAAVGIEIELGEGGGGHGSSIISNESNDGDHAGSILVVDDPIRKFMGPSKNDDALLKELRHRRRDKLAVSDDGSYRLNSRDVLPYDTVSYKLLDTPVWHHYTLCLGDDGAGDDSNRNRNRNRKRRRLRSSRTRWVTAVRRWFFTCPRDRRGNVANPVRTYQMDTQFVTRCVLIAIGFTMSVVGFAVAVGANKLLLAKIEYSLQPTIDSEVHTEPFVTGYTRFVLLNLLFGLLACLPVAYYRPVSAGSGIAEAKAILNGIILPCCTELRTALVKAFSVVLASAASLPVGLEGLCAKGLIYLKLFFVYVFTTGTNAIFP